MFLTFLCMILCIFLCVWSLLPVDEALARDSGYAPLAAFRCVRRPWLVPAVWPLSDYPASEVAADPWWVVPQGMHPRFWADDSKELGTLCASPFSGCTRNVPRVLRDRLDTWQSRHTLWIRVTHTSILILILIPYCASYTSFCISYSSPSFIVYTFVLLLA